MNVGDRVRLTEYAAHRNITVQPRRCKSGTGTLVGWSHGHPKVLWDGYMIAQPYHPDFIEPIQENKDA